MRIIKFFIIFLFRLVYVSIILGHVFYFAIQYPPFFSKVSTYLSSYLVSYDISIKDFSVDKILISNDVILMEDISLKAIASDKTYDVKADQILIKRIGDLKIFKECRIIFHNGFLSSKDFHVEKGNGFIFVQLMSQKNVKGTGNINIKQARFKDYTCFQLGFDIDFDKQQVDVSELKAFLYEGKLSAYGSYSFRPQEKINGHVSLQGIDTSEISFLQDKFKGDISGDFVYQGTRDEVAHFEGTFSSVSGEVSSMVMKYLMGDVGSVLSFLPFSDVLEKTSFIHVDKLQGSTHNIDQDSMQVNTKIEANALPLILNSSVTINLR